MTTAIEASLDRFMAQLEQAGPLMAEYEPDWPTPCVTDAPDAENQVQWQPVRQEPPASFTNVEEALGITLNAQLCTFFSRYYAMNLPASAAQGPCELLQAINADDVARLQENLIGHVLMKRRLKQPETLFFGLTDQDELILSVDNQTGQVLLERVGKADTEVLAADLASFLDSLTPAV